MSEPTWRPALDRGLYDTRDEERAALRQNLLSVEDWEPTRWWRAVGPDGKVWCESSDEQEVRSMARTGDRVERLFRSTEQRWVEP